MTKRCVNCGMELDKTSWGRYNCRNCGMLSENNDNLNTSDVENPSYVQ